MLNAELREGKQHCQKGTPEFLTSTIDRLKKLNLKDPLLFRFDGGNDSKDILSILDTSGHFFIVKRNLRKELPDYWLSVAQAQGSIVYQDESKTVYVGVHTGKKPAQDESFREIRSKCNSFKISNVILQYPAIYRSKGSEFSRQSSL